MHKQNLRESLDPEVNDLMVTLDRNRVALAAIQQRVSMNPTCVGSRSAVLTSLHDAERTLIDLRCRLESPGAPDDEPLYPARC